MPELEVAPSSDFTSGEIATAAKEPAVGGASPASQKTEGAVDTAASTRVTPAPAGDERYKGWVPPDVHERIVDGFHRRVDETAWAQGLTRAEVEEALALRRSVNASRQAASTASAEPKPDALDEHRQPYYSPEQAGKWAAWKADQIVTERMKGITERLDPIESAFANAERQDGYARQIENAQTWPGFVDHVADITAAITKNNQDRQRNPRIPALSLHEAYISIVPAKLAASREALVAEEKKKWLADLNGTTAVTRNEINPARSHASSARKKDSEMSFGELIGDEVAKRKAG